MTYHSGIRYGFLWGLLLVLLSQCSPYAGRSVLSFFFDGVPQNDSLQTELAALEDSTANSLNPEKALMVRTEIPRFIHYPYEEGECSSCHNQQSLGTMIEPQPGLCYLCHEDLGTVYTYLHGPVAGGYCTSCHDPHESESEKLLRRTGDGLCFFCHGKQSVEKNEMHQDLEGMPCMDCHNPHGGDDKYIFH